MSSGISNQPHETSLIGKPSFEGKAEETIVKQDMRLADGRRVSITLYLDKNTTAVKAQHEMEKIAAKINGIAPNMIRSGLQPKKTYSLLEDGTHRVISLGKDIDEIRTKLPAIKFSFILHPHVPPPKKEIHFETDRMEHLFLKETPKFFELFLDKLIIRYPACEEEIAALKKEGMRQLEGLYGPKYGEWREGKLSRAEALQRWGTAEEKTRQAQASTLLNEAIYDALAVVGSTQDLTSQQISTVHKSITQEIAEDRREEIVEKESGLINFEVQFTIHTEEGRAFKVGSQTQQYSKNNITSLDRRDEHATGLINAMVVSDTFTEGNRSFTTSRLRSGSADYQQVEIKKEEEIIRETNQLNRKIVSEEEENEIKKQFHEHRTNGSEADYIQSIRSALNENNELNAKACAVVGLILLEEGHPLSQTLISEAKQFQQDNAIVKKNGEMLEPFLKDRHALAFGREIPPVVRAIFQNEDIINSSSKPWGIINLQTPVNIVGGKGINTRIRSLAENSKMPKALRKQLNKLTASDISELNNIYRDMLGYKKACQPSATRQKSAECYYFNFPTNFIGRKRSIFQLGSKSLRLRINSLFNVGMVDKTRAYEIEMETHENVKKVYALNERAIEALKKALKVGGKAEEMEEVERYLRTLESLRDQTFDVEPGGVKLKMPPNPSAQFESIARLTVLMEMLNMVTKGNCRSGNNRTAYWEAKSKQIDSCAIASVDGTIPDPSVTAATYRQTKKGKRGTPEPHWSLGVFAGSLQGSLALQKANKGTEGTKEEMSEYKHKGLRGAVLKGAFHLAQQFDEQKFSEALNKQVGRRESESPLSTAFKKIIPGKGSLRKKARSNR